MSHVVKVLDERRWNVRLFWADLAALGLLLVFGGAMLVDAYFLGASGYFVAHVDSSATATHDAALIRMLGEMLGFALSFAWLGYRVVRGGYETMTAL